MNNLRSQLKRLRHLLGSEGELVVRRQFSPRATLLEYQSPNQAPHRLIMKQHSAQDRRLNPFIARDEFRLLSVLWQAGLPVPKPLCFDLEREPPCLVTEYVAGEPRLAVEDLASHSAQLAVTLSAIHRFDIVRYDLSFLPAQQDRIANSACSNAEDPLGIRAALRAALPRMSMNKATLLHGDFWPGNLIWQRGELAAIIDWEDAMLGDPLGDLGKSRLETLWAFGEDFVERYTASYLARNPVLNAEVLPFWDLWGALRLSHFADWPEDNETKLRMSRQYERFVRDALTRL